MKIQKLEQSGFIIETDAGYKLGIDIGAFSPAENVHEHMVDAMLSSHLHGDHFAIPQVKKIAPKKLYLNRECIELLGEEEIDTEITEVKVGETIDIQGIKISFFDVDHGPNATLRPLENFGFLIEVDAKKIYFAGDMYYPSGMDVVDLEVDLALIPVGGHYTFGPEEALAFVSTFRHICAIVPMHYDKTPDTKEVFVKLATEKGFAVDVL
ncbi:MAG: MBL fold metallo-hydrolase [bacterium]